MNCNKCSELLADFLDGRLSGNDNQLFNAHLQDCLQCASVREDVHQIMEAARAERGVAYAAPPNKQALWARIVNEIESEQQRSHSQASAVASSRSATANTGGFWARTLNKRWELSFAQLSTAVASIAVVVAISTALGVRRLPNIITSANTSSAEMNLAGASAGGNNEIRTAAFEPEDYVRQQQSSLQYLQQRIEYRQARWSRGDREAFERAMTTINETVNDSLNDLRRNPHDEVSKEMLNLALRDKMELLREFSQL